MAIKPHRARLWVDRKSVHLGSYQTGNAAADAQRVAAAMRDAGRSAAEITNAFASARNTQTASTQAAHAAKLDPKRSPKAFERLAQLYEYNAATGEFTRRLDAPSHLFFSPRHHTAWLTDTRNPTQRRTATSARLYVRPINGVRICATRLAWVLATGDTAATRFRYRDGNPENLRLDNIALDTN